MISYPIFITTSDPELEKYNDERYIYFVKTINSLEATTANLENLFVFDDNSQYLPKLKFLLTKSWHYYIKYRPENLGPTLNTIYAIDYIYKNNKDSEYIIFLQDDVVFSKTWLDTGINIFKQIDSDIKNNTGFYTQIESYSQIRKIGILCLYNRVGESKEVYYLFPTGHPGGVAWIIKTAFWKDYKNRYGINDCADQLLPRNERNDRAKHNKRHLVDYKLCHRAHSLGWDVAKVGKSLVQHIGDRSSLGDRDMTEHRSKNFVGDKL